MTNGHFGAFLATHGHASRWKDEEALSAGLLRHLRDLSSLYAASGEDSSDDGKSSCELIDRDPDSFSLLVESHGMDFGCMAVYGDCADSVYGCEVVEVTPIRGLVDCKACVEGKEAGGDNA